MMTLDDIYQDVEDIYMMTLDDIHQDIEDIYDDIRWHIPGYRRHLWWH